MQLDKTMLNGVTSSLFYYSGVDILSEVMNHKAVDMKDGEYINSSLPHPVSHPSLFTPVIT